MEPIRPFYFDLTDDDIDRFADGARRILKSGYLILGENTEAFERDFAAYVGTPHAVSTSSGTAALEILFRIKGVAGRTVLVPTNTNFATVAAVLYAGGRVRLLDMDAATFAPSCEQVEAALEAYADEDLAGVAWVHIGGVVSPEFPAVVELCRSRGLFVIEDAAHAHGSALGGRRVGSLADGACFSFFPTKVMTTGEGGMITTDDAEEAELARSYRNQGKRGVAFGGLHTDMGNSTRMTELEALLGSIFLERLPGMLDRRQAAYDVTARHLDAAGIGYVSTAHMDAASHYKMLVLPPDGYDPAALKGALAADNVLLGGTVYEIPCHRQPVFDGLLGEGSYPVADAVCPRHICPPLTSGTTPQQADHVGAALVRAMTVAAA